jgi:Cytochrome P450
MVEDLVNLEREKDAYLLAPLIKGVDSFLERPVNREELVEEAMGIMSVNRGCSSSRNLISFRFAGSGTTSTTLVYMLYALSRPSGQSVQEKLRQELENVPDSLQVRSAIRK